MGTSRFLDDQDETIIYSLLLHAIAVKIKRKMPRAAGSASPNLDKPALRRLTPASRRNASAARRSLRRAVLR